MSCTLPSIGVEQQSEGWVISDIRATSAADTSGSPHISGVVLFSVLLTALALSPSIAQFEGRLLLGVASAILACWFLMAGGTKIAGPVAVSGGLVFLAYLIAIGAGDSPRLSLEAAIPVLLALGVFVFSSSSVVPTSSIASSVGWSVAAISGVALYLWVRRVIRWMAAVAAVDPSASWAEQFPVTLIRAGTWSLHPNALAMVLEVGLPLLVLLSLTAQRSKFGWWAATALGGITLMLTGSRGGWLGGLGGVGVAVAVLRWRQGRRLAPRWVLIVVALAMIGAVALMATGFRPAWLFRATLEDRAAAIGAGLDMFGTDWVTGHGPGTYLLLLDRFVGDEAYSGVGRAVWSHAHNGYVQSALEVGAVGMILIVTATAWLARHTFRTSKASANEGSAILLPALAGASVALAVHSLVDVVTVWPGPLVLFAALAGLAARDGPSAGHAQRVVPIALVLSAPLVLVAALPAQLHYERGLDQAATGDWPAAVESFDTAWRWDPLPAYGLASTVFALEGGLIRTPTDLELVELRASRVPTDAVAQLNLGLAAMRTESPRAGELIDALSGIVVGDEVAIAQLGFMLEGMERAGEAEDLYLRALRINPWLADSVVWETLPDGMERRHRLLTELATEDGCRLIEHIVLLGIAGIEIDADHCPAGSLAPLYELVEEGDWADLVARVSERIAAAPDQPVFRRLDGLANLGLGELAAARRSWTIGALLNDGYSALRLVESYPVEEVPTEVLALVASVAETWAPVRDGNGLRPAYLLAAGRFQVTHQRTPPPSPLATDIWVNLTINHDRRLIDAVLAGYAGKPTMAP